MTRKEKRKKAPAPKEGMQLKLLQMLKERGVNVDEKIENLEKQIYSESFVAENRSDFTETQYEEVSVMTTQDIPQIDTSFDEIDTMRRESFATYNERQGSTVDLGGDLMEVSVG